MDNVSKTVKVEEEEVGDQTVQTKTVESDSDNSGRQAANKGIQIVYYLAGVLALLIGIRFLLILLGARNTGIVNFVYQLTQPFVSPFYGIFGQTIAYGSSRLEFESLLAVIFLGVILVIVTGFIRLLK